MTTTFANIKTRVTNRLNNSGLTDALAGEFVTDAMGRINRTLRIPTMERLVTLTVDSDGAVTLPSDYLQLKDLIYNDTSYGDMKLIKQERGAFEAGDTTGVPSYYTRIAGKFYIKPSAASGDTVDMVYYADEITLDEDTDVDPLFNVAPDLVVYGALIYAADYFQDERRNQWDVTFKELLMEVQAQADMQEMTEGYLAVGPGTSVEY